MTDNTDTNKEKKNNNTQDWNLSLDLGTYYLS